MSKPHIERLTKKYIIDFLNASLFSDTISWDSIDLYNELPIFAHDDMNREEEQRGALVVHKSRPKALRLLVTVNNGLVCQQVCYRLTTIPYVVKLDEINKVCYPFDQLVLDFSISDLNLGSADITSYSFSDNIEGSVAALGSRTFSVLRFLLDSEIVIMYDAKNFKDMLVDIISFPPIAGDPHYNPIFSTGE